MNRAPTAEPLLMTRGDQLVRQHRAIRLLSRLLDRNSHLTPIDWTVDHLGRLSGTVPAALPAAEINDVFGKWCVALDVRPRPARTIATGTTYLHATGTVDGEVLVLAARVFATEDAS